RLRQQLDQSQLDAIGGVTLNGPAEELPLVVEDLLDDERRHERDGGPPGRLLGGRGANDHPAQRHGFLAQGLEARGGGSIVVGQEDAHASMLLGRQTGAGSTSVAASWPRCL